MAKPNVRPDHNGTQRAQFESNKKKIYAVQRVCGICGKPVDFGFKFPHPLSPCIDHIVPVARGGHPSELSNLQLAHMTCNRQKSDKLAPKRETGGEAQVISNRVLPQTFDWTNPGLGVSDALSDRSEHSERRSELTQCSAHPIQDKELGVSDALSK